MKNFVRVALIASVLDDFIVQSSSQRTIYSYLRIVRNSATAYEVDRCVNDDSNLPV